MKPITKKQKRNEKILVEYEKLIAEGWPKMDAYKHIGEKHNLKEGGVRFAIQAAYVLRGKQVPANQNV